MARAARKARRAQRKVRRKQRRAEKGGSFFGRAIRGLAGNIPIVGGFVQSELDAKAAKKFGAIANAAGELAGAIGGTEPFTMSDAIIARGEERLASAIARGEAPLPSPGLVTPGGGQLDLIGGQGVTGLGNDFDPESVDEAAKQAADANKKQRNLLLYIGGGVLVLVLVLVLVMSGRRKS